MLSLTDADLRTTQIISPKLSVVVPTYNEYRNLRELVCRLDFALASVAWELIVVDDDSPDGTANLAKSMSARDGRIRCIRRIGRRGLAGACIEGIMSSSAPVVAVMDGDLQHDETILPKMLSLISESADLVVASRYVEGGSSSQGFSKIRKWGSQVATIMAREALGITISDPMSGFFMVRRERFEAAAPKLSREGFKILLDLIASSPKTMKIVEVPFQFRERMDGVSKLGSLVTFDYFGLLLSKISRGILPTRFIMFVVVGLFGIFAHLFSLYVLLNTFVFSFAVSQFLATMVAMTTNFFLNNELTFSDKKLRGWRIIPGLLLFYLTCSVGALANVGVASWINDSWHPHALLAGLAGAVLGAVYNYAASSTLTWRVQ
jgi:dolichol-phosphate mannosyltransferase